MNWFGNQGGYVSAHSAHATFASAYDFYYSDGHEVGPVYDNDDRARAGDEGDFQPDGFFLVVFGNTMWVPWGESQTSVSGMHTFLDSSGNFEEAYSGANDCNLTDGWF